jgi:hypothetical protein
VRLHLEVMQIRRGGSTRATAVAMNSRLGSGFPPAWV